MKWVGHVACIKEERNAYKIFVEKKKPPGRLRHRIVG
jgi:hypothetical protein